MVTIFSSPKAFCGHIGLIQKNAIKSWLCIESKPQIILLGNDAGVREICFEFGIMHVPEIEKNQYGTPLLNSLFAKAKDIASSEIISYVNSDIMLFNNFNDSIKLALERFPKLDFFISGRRWLKDVSAEVNFDSFISEPALVEYLLKAAVLDHYGAMDYFIFSKNALGQIPAFALGRCGWDNWLLYRAKSLGLNLIDATGSVTAIHQNHNYAHSAYIKPGVSTFITGPEIKANLKLCKGKSRFYTLLDADYEFNYNAIEKIGISRIIKRYDLKIRTYVWCILTEVLYPFSYPLILIIKVNKLLFSKFSKNKIK